MKPAADKQKVDLGLLEEDDEFEEFPTEHWGTEDADDADVSVWEDNWEDDIVQDDFSQQLKDQNLCPSLRCKPLYQIMLKLVKQMDCQNLADIHQYSQTQQLEKLRQQEQQRQQNKG